MSCTDAGDPDGGKTAPGGPADGGAAEATSLLICHKICIFCFFYFFLKFQYLVTSMIGWRQITSFPFANEQAMGAALSFFVLVFWLNRKYLLGIWDGLRPDLKSENKEPIPLKLAIGGLIGGLLFLLFFSTFFDNFNQVPLRIISWYLKLCRFANFKTIRKCRNFFFGIPSLHC